MFRQLLSRTFIPMGLQLVVRALCILYYLELFYCVGKVPICRETSHLRRGSCAKVYFLSGRRWFFGYAGQRRRLTIVTSSKCMLEIKKGSLGLVWVWPGSRSRSRSWALVLSRLASSRLVLSCLALWIRPCTCLGLGPRVVGLGRTQYVVRST